MITKYGGDRKAKVKQRYKKNINRSEWRKPTRYDIMNNDLI